MSIAIFIFSFLFCLGSFAESKGAEQIEACLANSDIQGARAVLRSMAGTSLDERHWLEVRHILQRNPIIGWDVIKFWDSVSPIPPNDFDRKLAEADRDMLDKKYDNAFAIYQILAKKITDDKDWKSGENQKLYWTIIHSMARALYAEKRFSEARKVYLTIPSSYELYRQVLFEMMWAAYRDNHVDYALGALTSQASGYFSNYLEPEVYLLQYYIYRRLCRNHEADEVYKNVIQLNDNLVKNKIKISKWLGKDVETLEYKAILLQKLTHKIEKQSFTQYLNDRFEADKKRMIDQLDLVIAHFKLARGQVKELSPIRTSGEVRRLLNSKYEKWDANDKEVWADEVGRHVFIGDNLCRK